MGQAQIGGYYGRGEAFRLVNLVGIKKWLCHKRGNPLEERLSPILVNKIVLFLLFNFWIPNSVRSLTTDMLAICDLL